LCPLRAGSHMAPTKPSLGASLPAGCRSKWSCVELSRCPLCHCPVLLTAKHCPVGYATTSRWGTRWPSGRSASGSCCWASSAPTWPSRQMPCACADPLAPSPQSLHPRSIHPACPLAERLYSYSSFPSQTLSCLPQESGPWDTIPCLPPVTSVEGGDGRPHNCKKGFAECPFASHSLAALSGEG
jgi:hypothetical protein